MKPFVRKATMFDHTEILILVCKWFEESQIIKGYDEAASNWLSNMITYCNSRVFVVVQDAKIVGCVGIRITQFPWNSKDSFIVCDFIMTDPQHRKNGVAKLLLDAMKDVAHEINLPLLIGHASGTDPELKDKYFAMQGFKYLGSNLGYNGD